jgi:periplasmic protein CpxP/Spy
MNRNKSLALLILVLLAGNAVLLYLYLSKDKKPRRDRMAFMRERLKKEIGFNDSQAVQFEDLRNKQREQMRQQGDSMRKLRGELYDAYNNGQPDSVINRLLAAGSALQMQADRRFFEDLREARKICTPAQLPAFDSIMKNMMLNRGGPYARGRMHTKTQKTNK